MQIPDSIRKWRLARGYKQEALAEHLGITQQTFSDIERGIICLKPDMAEKIALFLNIPVTEIYFHPQALPRPATDTEKELLQQLLCEKDKSIALLEQLLEERTRRR